MMPDENIIVVTGKHLRRGVSEALPWLPRRSILCEPEGRNTAACVAWAALEVLARDPDGVMAVLAADHVIEPMSDFRAALNSAMAFSDGGSLVTFGVEPDHAATGYGYIRAGKPIDGGPARRVLGFKEKPDLATARRYVASGNYYWNSGMFAWRADTIWAEVRRHLPRLARGLGTLEKCRSRGRIAQADVDKVYPRLESISIDNGVLERSDRIAVLPASFSWNDIGSWDAVGDLWPRDASGNSSRQRVIAVRSEGNVVATQGKPVALVGVNDLVVVDSGDVLLVCRRDECQDVREIVARLDDEGFSKLK
jgi:mannose-1-phosphate guanylyltransferase